MNTLNGSLKSPFIVLLLTVGLYGCGESAPPSSTADSTGTGVEEVAEVDGAKIYGQFCFSCHGPGLNGAPKLGDSEAWAPRLAKGVELMLKTTIEGIPPAMPPRGLCMACSDEELRAAIVHMSGAE